MTVYTYRGLETVGRLGNQLWEIAGTVSVAARNDGVPRFEKWSYQEWFDVPADWFGPVPDDAVHSADLACAHIHPAQRGYMQCWHHLEDPAVASFVWSAFQPSYAAASFLADHIDRHALGWLPELNAHHPTVSISVRRGDNTDPVSHPVGTWPLVTRDYYRDAVASFADIPDAHFVVFSDESDWCVQHMPDWLDGIVPNSRLHFVPTGPTRPPEYGLSGYSEAPALDWVDLQLIATTQHHILGASTFSWWGAFLSQPGRVVYPDNWVGWRITTFDFRDLMPPDWVCVHNPVHPRHLSRRGR